MFFVIGHSKPYPTLAKRQPSTLFVAVMRRKVWKTHEHTDAEALSVSSAPGNAWKAYDVQIQSTDVIPACRRHRLRKEFLAHGLRVSS